MTVAVAGDGVQTQYTPPGTPIINAAAPAGGPDTVALIMGDNTLSVPLGATS